MKLILIIIAALVLVGCGQKLNISVSDAEKIPKTSESTDYSGTYTLSTAGAGAAQLSFELKSDGSFIGKSSMNPDDDLIGSWKVDGELLVCEGSAGKSTEKTVIKFNKTTGKVVSVNSGGKEVPTEELDLLKVKKS